jgi:hypothetical protein
MINAKQVQQLTELLNKLQTIYCIVHVGWEPMSTHEAQFLEIKVIMIPTNMLETLILIWGGDVGRTSSWPEKL